MPIRTKSILKTRFEDGDIPLGSDFADLIDSYLNQADDAHKLGPKTYDLARTYGPDDTCLFSQGSNYQLYRANKATTGTFVEADWDLVTSELDLTNYQALGNIFLQSPGTISLTSADFTDITSSEYLNFVGEKNTNIEGGESYIYLETPQILFNSGEKFIFSGGGVAAYQADVSGKYTERSLVDKAYVDNEVKTKSGGTTTIDDAAIVATKTWSSEKISISLANAISDLVSASPAALDTLKELANALGSDPNFATTITNLISQKVSASDVINNLSSSDASKPLSAAQGKTLKDLIDSITNTNGGPATAYVDAQDKKLQFKLSFSGSPIIKDYWQDAGSISNVFFGSDVSKLEVSTDGTAFSDLSSAANLPYVIAQETQLWWKVTFAANGNTGAVQLKGSFNNNI